MLVTRGLLIAVVLFVYCYVGYPLLLFVLTTNKESCETYSEWYPSVTMIVPAHNEATDIVEKLENIEQTQYPGEFDCLVISDSTDGTNELVQQYGGESVSLISLSERRGKSYAINHAAAIADSDIYVLSDANTLYEPHAVGALVAPLADRDVGVTTGKLAFSGETNDGESLYWRYELWLRRMESKLGTTVSINGGLLAIRTGDFEPLPTEALTDDFVLAMRQAQTGRRITYVPEAKGTETTTGDLRAEFHRRVRIGAGNFQALTWFWKLLDPRRGVIAVEFWSHKVLRWIMPGILVSITLLSALAALATNHAGYWLFLGLQVLAYGTAVLGLLNERVRSSPIVRIPTYFTVMNAAIGWGFIQYISGPSIAIWKKTR